MLARAVHNSVNLGIFTVADDTQVGFARAVTDKATFAWIADVFVLPAYRGHGLGRFVVSTLLEHPDLQGLRRTMLATADAHELYRSYGFEDLDDPSVFLGIRRDPASLYGRG